MNLEKAREIGRDWAREQAHTTQWDELQANAAHFAAVERGTVATLHLEDVSAIPFVSVISGVERYQHRARVRATDGDVFAAVTEVSEGYEPYCRDFLGLGAPNVVMAEPTDAPTSVARACRRGAAWHALCDWTRAAGEVVLHPYMSIEDVWELGAALRSETRANVSVLGPTPGALWTANDKASLSEVANRCLGPGWIMETETSRDAASLAKSLRRIAGYGSHVGLKRTRCASAMGNIVYASDWVTSCAPDELQREVTRFLDKTEWDGEEEVLAVEWGITDCSPSTQMWIPPLGAGDPVLHGIYEQLLEGEEKVFLGSRPSTLPEAVHRDLEHASMQVCAAFQAMGYIGRCSFDFIVLGDPNGEFDVRFTECNGRWGGTSTPMHLVDRLGWRDAAGKRKPYHAQDFVHPDLVGMSFEELRAAVAPELFDPKTRQGRFVLYNVGPLAGAGKFDVISLAETPQAASAQVADLLPSLLGL